MKKQPQPFKAKQQKENTKLLHYMTITFDKDLANLDSDVTSPLLCNKIFFSLISINIFQKLLPLKVN